jgi:hypothetical protein
MKKTPDNGGNSMSQRDAPAPTGKAMKIARPGERRGWRAVLIRQQTFEQLKELMKSQSGKRTLDLAGITDGIVAHGLSDPDRARAAIAEGRNRKREEFLAAANEWAD